VLARARALDEEAAAQRGASYAGEPDPYKKPREDDSVVGPLTEGFDVMPAADPDA
jgi:ribosome-binding factor A